jgi:cytochrome c1
LGTGVVANTPDLLRQWIRNAGSIKPGVLMPPFQNLSDADLAALADYLGSLK